MAHDPLTPPLPSEASLGADEHEVEAPTLAGSLALLDFWQAKVAANGALRRADLPAREIAALLPWLLVYEPVDDFRDAFLRLIGTGLVERYGANFTGRRLSEIMTSESAAQALARLRLVQETQSPRIVRGRLLGLDRDYIVYEIVVVPLLASDGVGRWALGGMFLKS